MAKIKCNTFFVWAQWLIEKEARRERFSSKQNAKKHGKDTYEGQGYGGRDPQHKPYDGRKNNRVYKKH